ncbi:6-hydroxymethylpterin diphosphokinase MptE-like protein [Psychromonas sp. KJ10-10]|uniref:6-hydroxymethylpterin diphosphokinase MptE-like protein n=1 Tax=Psychromonas sp. KJ10-10 TaxID=3391823 RepID=UPI0039B46259
MSSQIDPLLIKIQTQILQATFLKNMACLKLHMPSVYQFFQHYQPQKVQLAFDNNGEVNLSTGDQFVYGEDPKASSLAQVETFLKNPPCFDFEISLRNDENYQYQHEKVINHIYKKRRQELGVSSPFYMQDGGQINFIAVIGLGLGYHVEHLFKQFSIRSVYIFEPEPDVFFAALHTVDMSVWFNSCTSLGGELTFKIGGVESVFVNEIAQYFKREGYFLLPQLYLYRHYISDKTTDAFKLIRELEYRYKSGWGFCEDEIIGISHTLSNISDNKASILLENAKLYKKEQPVFIIGNGPSLDNDLAYIKANQEKAIIISSGTSLKPLLNYGITPDIHVEQERPKSIYQWVKKIGYENKLKEIPLLCLNTVYPGILNLFKQPYVMLKAGDAGTSFIHEYVSNKYLELFFVILLLRMLLLRELLPWDLRKYTYLD